ncbi:MAG TPA: hypothetical protein VMF13_03880 [Luteitalea sp.]|nr:hypothetical protein [Luteitalea sp.]
MAGRTSRRTRSGWRLAAAGVWFATLLCGVSAVVLVGAQSPKWTEKARMEALGRAEVWRQPQDSPMTADLSRPPDALGDEVTCRFRVTAMRGTVRKFTCTLPTGETLRVKYAGPEPHGEVAASRLLLALGFDADRVGFVRKVRCMGCPWSPFATLSVVTLARAGGLYERVMQSDKAVDFDWVAVERAFEGEQIRTDTTEGWTFEELSRVRTASREHTDALRLLAVFLAHWDNKSENQRLVCLSGAPRPDGTCAQPFAMLQDVGATFGPRKVNLAAWRAARIWTDRARCEIGMDDLPHGGATFVRVAVSEAGRRFLASRLQALSDDQLAALFRGARFEPRYGAISDWVAAFKARTAQIADGPACPA